MIDRLNETCTAFGIEINVRKTKVMILNKIEKPKRMARYAISGRSIEGGGGSAEGANAFPHPTGENNFFAFVISGKKLKSW